MEACKDCRYFRPQFYSYGACTRQNAPNSKFFTDNPQANVLVHIGFGCILFDPQPPTEEDTL